MNDSETNRLKQTRSGLGNLCACGLPRAHCGVCGLGYATLHVATPAPAASPASLPAGPGFPAGPAGPAGVPAGPAAPAVPLPAPAMVPPPPDSDDESAAATEATLDHSHCV